MGRPTTADTEESHFSSIPWCKKILEDPDFAVEPTGSRIPNPDRGPNDVIAQTLKTSNTIEGWCSLYRRPSTSARHAKDEVKTLLALRPGLDGYIRVCHGGITATILDEVMSMMVSVCRGSQGLHPDNVTADLRVKFVRPVPTPSVVLVTAKVTDIQKERKYFVDADMVDEKGVVLARAEGLFVHVLSEKL